MKKILAYVIVVAVLLAVFSTSTMAGNPPGMIVRQDDRLEDTPWGDLSAVEPTRSDIETKQTSSDTEAVIFDDIATIVNIFSPVNTVLVIDIIIMAEGEQ